MSADIRILLFLTHLIYLAGTANPQANTNRESGSGKGTKTSYQGVNTNISNFVYNNNTRQ